MLVVTMIPKSTPWQQATSIIKFFSLAIRFHFHRELVSPKGPHERDAYPTIDVLRFFDSYNYEVFGLLIAQAVLGSAGGELTGHRPSAMSLALMRHPSARQMGFVGLFSPLGRLSVIARPWTVRNCLGLFKDLYL